MLSCVEFWVEESSIVLTQNSSLITLLGGIVDYSRTVRAAAVQISPVLFSRDGTTEKVLQAIA